MRHLRPWICSIGLLALSGHAAAQEKAATQPAGPPVVSLLDAGAGPGRTLRLQTQVGAAQTLRLSIRMSLRQTLNQAPRPNRPQTSMNFTLDTVVTSVDANGDISYDFEITNVDVGDEPGVPPALANSIQRLLEPAVGVRGSGVTSDRGFSKQVRIPVPPGTSPILERQLIAIEEWLAQMTTPFPADPVAMAIDGPDILDGWWAPAAHFFGFFGGILQGGYRVMMGACDIAFFPIPKMMMLSPVPRYKILPLEHDDE